MAVMTWTSTIFFLLAPEWRRLQFIVWQCYRWLQLPFEVSIWSEAVLTKDVNPWGKFPGGPFGSRPGSRNCDLCCRYGGTGSGHGEGLYAATAIMNEYERMYSANLCIYPHASCLWQILRLAMSVPFFCHVLPNVWSSCHSHYGMYHNVS